MILYGIVSEILANLSIVKSLLKISTKSPTFIFFFIFVTSKIIKSIEILPIIGNFEPLIIANPLFVSLIPIPLAYPTQMVALVIFFFALYRFEYPKYEFLGTS